jgi:hypothetical protein
MSFDEMTDSAANGGVWERLNRAKTKSAQLRAGPTASPCPSSPTRATFEDAQSVHSVHSVHSSASKISLRSLDGQFTRSSWAIPDCDNIQNPDEKRRFLRDIYEAQKGWAFLAHERPSAPGTAEAWRYRQRWPFFDPPNDAQPPSQPWAGERGVFGTYGGPVQHGYISPSPIRNRQSDIGSASPKSCSPRQQPHPFPAEADETTAAEPCAKADEPEEPEEPLLATVDESQPERPPKAATFSTKAEDARLLCPKAAGWGVIAAPKSFVQ